MILQQHYLACLSQASYLIGDEETKTAVVVDPRRDVDLYLEEAAKLGLTIRHVILTHFHADFLAGHLELRERVGARIHLGASARADFEFGPLADGDVIELGALRLEILETPGHTPESISIVVRDSQASDGAPHAVLTGDTLFIGDVGRPDLMASVGASAEELAGMMYDSLHDKLLCLPDETLLYPGHGAGSSCGKNLSSDTVCTLGRQRETNYALQPMSREQFVALVAAGLPAAPAYFAHDADLNRRERPLLDETLERALVPLSLEEVLALQNQGAQVLDARSADDWAAGHLADSVNVGLGGRFASWVGTVLASDRGIVILVEPGREEEAAVRLGRIGFDRVLGFLEGGLGALDGHTEFVRSARRVAAAELADMLAAEDAPIVIDIRAPGEWQAGHVEGARHVPLNELEARVEEFPRDRPFVLQCGSGYRSTIAASLLERHGYDDLCDQNGGFGAWAEGMLPVVIPAVTEGDG